MAKYVFIYKGGNGMPESEEEGRKLMAAWTSWLGGIDATDAGNPFGASTAVGGKASGLTGYSIVEASSLDDAAAKAKGCPILDGGNGTVEVYEALAM